MATLHAVEASIDPIDASVVICTYTEDRWDDLTAAIESVRRQSRVPTQVILVVDHAPALEARIRVAFPEALTVANGGRPGLSGGRNTGIAASTGSIVVFLDDDAVAEDEWLGRLLAPFADPGVVATGGLALSSFDRGRPVWFPPEFDWVVGCTYRGHPLDGEIRNPLGCNMAIRRSAFDGIDWFREDMGRSGTRPLGCEETELCIRLRRQDPRRRILMVPSAVVTQRVPAPRSTFRYLAARCFAEGISKATVSQTVGRERALASERRYATRVLPRAAWDGVGESLRIRSGDGARRALTIGCGLLLTTAGFAYGSVRQTRL